MPILSDADLRALLATCAGTDFTARRDSAVIMPFLDGGLRLSELAGLQVADVDLRDRIVFVAGNASRRSGPRHRAVPLGVKAARALDRLLRERRRTPRAAVSGGKVVPKRQATALAPPGWLAVAGLIGQLTSDALPQRVEMAHQLGQGPGGVPGRVLGADDFEQAEDLKLLGVAESLGGAHHRLPVGA
jgi:integrase